MIVATIAIDSSTNSNIFSRKFFETLKEAISLLLTLDVVTVIVLTDGSNSWTAYLTIRPMNVVIPRVIPVQGFNMRMQLVELVAFSSASLDLA